MSQQAIECLELCRKEDIGKLHKRIALKKVKKVRAITAAQKEVGKLCMAEVWYTTRNWISLTPLSCVPAANLESPLPSQRDSLLSPKLERFVAEDPFDNIED